jgi:hypothetical protein
MRQIDKIATSQMGNDLRQHPDDAKEFVRIPAEYTTRLPAASQ